MATATGLRPIERATELPGAAPPLSVSDGSGDVGFTPVNVYNARIKDEMFYVGNGPHAQLLRFRHGRFIATSAQELNAAQAAVAMYGADKPEAWTGDNRFFRFADGSYGAAEPDWQCPYCTFSTGNENAKHDHEIYSKTIHIS